MFVRDFDFQCILKLETLEKTQHAVNDHCKHTYERFADLCLHGVRINKQTTLIHQPPNFVPGWCIKHRKL